MPYNPAECRDALKTPSYNQITALQHMNMYSMLLGVSNHVRSVV